MCPSLLESSFVRRGAPPDFPYEDATNYAHPRKLPILSTALYIFYVGIVVTSWENKMAEDHAAKFKIDYAQRGHKLYMVTAVGSSRAVCIAHESIPHVIRIAVQFF